MLHIANESKNRWVSTVKESSSYNIVSKSSRLIMFVILVIIKVLMIKISGYFGSIVYNG